MRLARSLRSMTRRFGLDVRAVSRWSDKPTYPVASLIEDLCVVFADRPISIVQVGANDGRANDPLWWAIRYLNVRALLIEPLPEPFAVLARTHASSPRVKTLQAAVGVSDGSLTLYRFDPATAPPGASRVASFSRENVEHHRASHRAGDAAIIEQRVALMSPATLLGTPGFERPDALVIDAEGMDAQIASAFLACSRPWLVQFEATNLSDQQRAGVEADLERHEYVWIYTRSDCIAQRRDFFPRTRSTPNA